MHRLSVFGISCFLCPVCGGSVSHLVCLTSFACRLYSSIPVISVSDFNLKSHSFVGIWSEFTKVREEIPYGLIFKVTPKTIY